MIPLSGRGKGRQALGWVLRAERHPPRRFDAIPSDGGDFQEASVW